MKINFQIKFIDVENFFIEAVITVISISLALAQSPSQHKGNEIANQPANQQRR